MKYTKWFLILTVLLNCVTAFAADNPGDDEPPPPKSKEEGGGGGSGGNDSGDDGDDEDTGDGGGDDDSGGGGGGGGGDQEGDDWNDGEEDWDDPEDLEEEEEEEIGNPGKDDKEGGDPFYLHSGEFYYKKVFLKQRDPLDLCFEIRYSSFFDFHSVVGLGWTFNYNLRVHETDDGKMVVRRSDGTLMYFAPISGMPDHYKAQDRSDEIIEKNGDGTYTLTTRKQMVYYFGATGRLEKISNGKGAELRLTYDSAGLLPITGVARNSNITSTKIVTRDYRLTRVEQYLDGTASGVYLDFDYTAAGYLETVTDQAGRSIDLTQNTAGDLTNIDDPEDHPYVFTYYTGNRLMQTYRGDGTVIGMVRTNTYDTSKRLTRQEMTGATGGQRIDVSYTTSYTQMTYTVRNSAGSTLRTMVERVYFIVDAFGVKQVSKKVLRRGSAFDDSSSETDDHIIQYLNYNSTTGRVGQVVLPNGGTIDYVYDSNGNVTSKTELVSSGVNRITEYLYNADNYCTRRTIYQSDRSTEKFITVYEYDTQNRRTAVKEVKNPTASEGSWIFNTWQYGYDDEGRFILKTNPRSISIAFEYDDPDYPNLITREYDPDNTSREMIYTYDDAGYRATREDSLGRVMNYDYDDLGRLIEETDANGFKTVNTYTNANLTQVETGKKTGFTERVVKLVYDTFNRPIQVKRVNDANSDVLLTSYTYDSEHKILTETNALGQVTTYVYDSNGWVTEIQRPYKLDGSTPVISSIKYTYDKSGRVTSMLDPYNVETRFAYDYLNRMTSMIEAYGTSVQRTTTYVYNAQGSVVSRAYFDGTNTLTTSYTYDALNRKIEISGDREYPMVITYDGNDNVLTKTDANNKTTSFEYDDYNRLIEITYSDDANYTGGNKTLFEYDLVGNLITITDGKGNHQHFAYDNLSRRTHTSIPKVSGNSLPGWPNWTANSSAVQSSVGYNAWGQIITSSNIAGATASNTYDRFGRLSGSTNASGLTLSYAYNAIDKVTSITYPAVNSGDSTTSIQFVYGTATSENGSLLKSSTDRAGNQTLFTYDKRFKLSSQTSSLGAVTGFTYDDLARLKTSTNHLSETTTYAYDQFDQVKQITYPDHVATTHERLEVYTYDDFGKVLTHSGAGAYPITYTYDAAGNRETMTDGNSEVTEWDYDSRNRVIKKTYADAEFYEYEYDAVGNMESRTDGEGVTTTYSYNEFNLLDAINYPNDPDVTFDYDPMGRMTSMIDATGETSWTYDEANRVEANTQEAVDRIVTYEYDVEDRRTSMEVKEIGASSGWETTYEYDQYGRLDDLTDPQISTTPFHYVWNDDAQLIEEVQMPSGAKIVKDYDILARLESMTNKDSTATVVSSFAYNYDMAGQRTSETFDDNSRREFDYDLYRQVTSAERYNSSNVLDTGFDYAYDFDLIGNRETVDESGSSQTYAVNSVNQYTSLTATPSYTFAYDDNGSMTGDGSTTYEWDEENRLKAVEIGSNRSEFTYDGLGKRIEKREYVSSVLQNTVRYVYDGKLSVQELDGSNDELRSITRGMDIAQGREGAGGIGGLLALKEGSNKGYYFYDGNGNVVDMIDGSDTSVAHYEYDIFGKRLVATGSMSAQSYQWSSKEYHSESGMVYYLYRFYRPDIGRWINRDPIEERGGLNLYGFVGNSSINSIDPHGKFGFIGAAIGGVIGGVAGGVANYISSGGDINATIAGVAGGVVGGAIVGSGAGLIAGVVAGAISGAVGETVEQVVEQNLKDQPISLDGDQIATAALVGAVTGGAGSALKSTATAALTGSTKGLQDQLAKNMVDISTQLMKEGASTATIHQVQDALVKAAAKAGTNTANANAVIKILEELGIPPTEELINLIINKKP